MTQDQLITYICDNYGEGSMLLADGFHQSFIGVSYDISVSALRAVYSIQKCIQHLINDGMTEEEATEYFEFNVSGAYVGHQTPIWLNEFEEIP